MTLLERIRCSRDDDPSQHDKPRPPKVEPEWMRRAREARLPAKVTGGSPA